MNTINVAIHETQQYTDNNKTDFPKAETEKNVSSTELMKTILQPFSVDMPYLCTKQGGEVSTPCNRKKDIGSDDSF